MSDLRRNSHVEMLKVDDMIDPEISPEEENFEAQRLGFSTERHSTSYRHAMKSDRDEVDNAWISKFPKIIGKLVWTLEQI